MKNATKFTFDTHFDDGTPEAPVREARSRKSYSAEEIETIRNEARKEGRSAADILATQAVAVAIGQVANAVLTAMDAMDEEVEAMRSEAASLAFAAAKKLAGTALDCAPDEEVARALQIALHQAIGEPRVVIRTTPALAGRIEKRATEIAAQEGFEGRLQFVPDTSLAGADCRIEWRGGGIERNQAGIENALLELIARRFPNPGKRAEGVDHGDQ